MQTDKPRRRRETPEEKLHRLTEIERGLWAEGHVVAGIDEVGRGPLAGPVVTACVSIPADRLVPGVDDSKKLSEKRREALFPQLMEAAGYAETCFIWPEEIDEINILNATFLAMRRAVEGLSVRPEIALVDGNRKPGTGIEEITLVKGDAKSISIAAASILAKVSRDRYLLELDKQYPQYQFAKHKGYPTALHYEMIKQYGISPVHRLSFLKNLNEK